MMIFFNGGYKNLSRASSRSGQAVDESHIFFPFLLREKYGHEFLIETFNEVIAEPQKEDEPFLSSRR